MTQNLVWASMDSSVEEIVEIMKINGIRRVPLVHFSENNLEKCVGLVSIDDLISDQLVGSEDLSRIVNSQVNREGKLPDNAAKLKRARIRHNQTLTRFNSYLANAVGLNRTTINRLIETILGNVLRRIHFGEAKDFIAQLPEKWQEDFLDLPAAPDRQIKATTLLKEVCNVIKGSPEEGTEVIRSFWDALGDLVSKSELLQVAAQLPKDMEELILGEKVSELHKPRGENHSPLPLL